MNSERTVLQLKIDTLFNIINDLPETFNKQKNIFDISGISRRENILSNLLAFYLDKNEDHGFGPVFLECLCELIQEKGIEINTDSDYEVIREYKDIDILIASRNLETNNEDRFNWAIIIEHKIHHNLDNDLSDYWTRVKVIDDTKKIGIVLSPWGQKDQTLLDIKKEVHGQIKYITSYLDLKHKDWMEKVKMKLSNYYLSADNFHILILRDFLKNIESMYMSQEERKKKEAQLAIFQSNYKEIKEIFELEKNVRNYVVSESINVMNKFGYSPNTPYTSRDKFFFKDREDLPDYFRFYFWYPTLIEKGELKINFELHKKYIPYGEDFHKNLLFKQLIEKKKNLTIKTTSKSGSYYHLASISDHSFAHLVSKDNLGTHLYNVLDDVFFNEDNGVLWKCTEILEGFIKS